MDIEMLSTIFAFITMVVEGVSRALDTIVPKAAGTNVKKLVLFALSILLGILIAATIPEVVILLWDDPLIAANPAAILVTGTALALGSKGFYFVVDTLAKLRKAFDLSNKRQAVEYARSVTSKETS